MDASLRQMVFKAVDSENDMGLVKQIYKDLKTVYQSSLEKDSLNTCGLDLYVQCAELALKYEEREMARELLGMYFNGDFAPNQFLCRAYLCQAQILYTPNSTSINDLLTAIVYLMKTLDFCKDKPRYAFLVYNTSVIYWNMLRSFFKSKHQPKLCESFDRVVKSLDSINDNDYEWRATLKIALLEGYAFAGLTTEAGKAAQEAYWFCVRKCPDRVADVIKLQIKYKLAPLEQLSSQITTEYNAFVLLQTLKNDPSKRVELLDELKTIVISLRNETPSVRKTLSTASHSKLTMHQRLATIEDERVETRPTPTIELRPSSVDVHRKFIHEVEIEKDMLEVVKMSKIKELLRVCLLFEIARFCVDQHELDIVYICLKTLKQMEVKDQTTLLQIEFMECDLMLKELGNEEESFNKSSVDVRLAAIKRMVAAVSSARRLGRANLVQSGCACLWNMCLPLLQKDLRKTVCRTLHLIADALEDISSMNFQLCCQVHTEIAITEEGLDQNETATKHLKKALTYDHNGLYRERLQNMLHRLTLSSQLYETPQRSQDLAAVIIEQAKKSSESGNSLMKRSLLAKVGLALAPDGFQNVLDGEDVTKVTKQSKNKLEMLSNRARHWEKSMKKVKGHLKRFGNENDRERARLWVDLVKTSRQQRIWDVCRTASMFCMLYDDGRWNYDPAEESVQDGNTSGDSSGLRSGSKSTSSKTSMSSQESSNDGNNDQRFITNLQNFDFMRMIAEVCFICGEAFVHMVQSEGVEFNNVPTNKPPKTYPRSGITSEVGKQWWLDYCEWIQVLNEKATKAFVRGIEIGVELDKSWIVCSGSIYLWNYNCHLLSQYRFTELVPTFEILLDSLIKVGHLSETVLVARLCNAIGRGLMLPWVPTPAARASNSNSSGGGSKSKTSVKNSKKQGAEVDPESGPDLKRALKVVEHGLTLTNGSNSNDVIPIFARHPLIMTWVQLKQLLSQSISPPHYGCEHEELPEQGEMTKCLVLMEMIALNDNFLTKFPVPTLNETFEVIENTSWDDEVTELNVWSQLCSHAAAGNNHQQLVIRCVTKTLKVQDEAFKLVKTAKPSQTNNHRRTIVHETMSNVYRIHGETLMLSIALNPSQRPIVLNDFVESTKHGELAGNYDFVIKSARLWWEAAKPLASASSECDKLRNPLNQILQCIRRIVKINKSPKETKPERMTKTASVSIEDDEQSSEDLVLRVSLYGLLFKTYAVKNEWEDGLKMLEQALLLLPRTKHRISLFKHRVIAKAKLGHDVYMDLNKFKDEDEESVARIWREVALSSLTLTEQLFGYQRAVEALTSPTSQWLKFELLLELATWMYDHNLERTDCQSVIQWSVDVMLNMTTRRRETIVSGRKSYSRRSSASRRSSKRPTSESRRRSSKGFEDKRVDSHDSTKDSSVRKQSLGKEEQEELKHLIGIEPLYTDIQFEDLKNVRQLEGLVRSHVQLATLVTSNKDEHVDYLQLAALYVLRLWKVVHEPALKMKRYLAKLKEEDEKAQRALGKKEKQKLEKKGGLALPPKPKRKTNDEHLPMKTSSWCHYDVSDEMVAALATERNEYGLNEKNIPSPIITINSLLQLSELLRSCGSTHLAVPVLSLASVVAQTSLRNASVLLLVRLNQIQVSYELQQRSSAQYWESLLEQQLPISGKDLAKYRYCWTSTGCNEDGVYDVTRHDLVDVWCRCSRLYLKLGYIQTGRILLKEAVAAIEFKSAANKSNDARAQMQVFLAQADLAIHDGNSDAALQHINQAQLLGADLHIWEDIINLLTSAITLSRRPHGGDCAQAGEILKSGENTLETLLHKFPAKQPELRRLQLLLTVKRLFLKLQIHSNDFFTNASALDKVETELEGYISTRQLALLRKEHVKLALVCLNHQESKEEVEEGLLGVIDMVTKLVNEMHAYAGRVVGGVVDGDISLPIAREKCEVELMLADVLLKSEQIHAYEHRIAETQEAKKGTTARIVEKYVNHPSVLDSMGGERWKEERTTFLHRSLTLLNSLYCRNTIVKNLNSNWSCLMGRALRLLSERFNFEHVHYQWSIDKDLSISDVMTSSTAASPTNSGRHQRTLDQIEEHRNIYEAGKVGANTSYYLSREEEESRSSAVDIQFKSELAIRALCHATQVLGQTIKVALKEQNIDVVGDACAEMIECCGQCDVSLTAACLALLQSCTAIGEMTSVLDRSLFDPDSCLLSSFTWQKSFLDADCLSTGLDESTVSLQIKDILKNKTTAWKNLSLTADQLDVFRELPSSFSTVILQEKAKMFQSQPTDLYCAVVRAPSVVVDNSKSRSSHKDKSNAVTMSLAAVTICPLDEEEFRSVGAMQSEFESKQMGHLLKLEYQRTQMMLKSKVMANVQESTYTINSKPATDVQANTKTVNITTTQRDEEYLKEDFNNILAQLDGCFRNISQFLEENLLTANSLTNQINQPASTSPPPPPTDGNILPSVYIILLTNRRFYGLPIENLTNLRLNPHIFAISRDFSLQMLHRRLAKDDGAHDDKKAKKPSGKLGSGGRRAIPPDCIIVDSKHTKYMVDANNETVESTIFKPKDVFKNLVKETYMHGYAHGWTGHYGGATGTPTPLMWEDQITRCRTFIYYGMESFASQVQPHKLVSLPMHENRLMLLIDKSQTNTSFMNQSKANVDKRESVISLERPYDTAVLLSLNGVKSICMNQWHTTSQANATNLNKLAHLMYGEGVTLGRAVRKVWVPIFEPRNRKDSVASGKGSKKQLGSEKSKAEGKNSKKNARASISEPASPPNSKRAPKKKSLKSEPVVGDTDEDAIDLQALHPPAPTAVNCNFTLIGLPNLMMT